MSNIIPPLLSSSPPPIASVLDDEEEDEFGDFAEAGDISYGCDALSLPTTPETSPNKNWSTPLTNTVEKDFRDKRKLNENDAAFEQVNFNTSDEIIEISLCKAESYLPSNTLKVPEKISDTDIPETTKVKELANSEYETSSIFDENVPNFSLKIDTTLHDTHLTEDNVKNAINISFKTESNTNVNSITNKSIEEIENDFIPEPHLAEGQNISIKSKDEISTEATYNEAHTEISEENTDTNQELENNTTKTEKRNINCAELDDSFCDLTEPNFENDFGNFEGQNFDLPEETSVRKVTESTELNLTDDDEFGDFDDYSTTATEDFCNLSMADAYHKAENVIVEMFPNVMPAIEDYINDDFIKDDPVFAFVKDVTETYALTYQWNKSLSQKDLLKALNIDMRNILYGHGWNPMVPKFAANLSASPLEPIKTEPQPQNMQTGDTSVTTQSTEIPVAQFDWSSSGLTNPLDSIQKNETIEPSELSEEIIQSNLPIKHTDNDSVKSLQFIEDPEPKEVSKEDFGDFTAFQSINMVPLRETYICTAETKEPMDLGWLKSTVLTPELERKNIKKENLEDVLSLVNTEMGHRNNFVPALEIERKTLNDDIDLAMSKNKEGQDDFADFQMSLPQKNIEIIKPLNPIKPSIMQKEISQTQINWPEPGLTEEELRNIEITFGQKNQSVTESKNFIYEHQSSLSVKNDSKESKSNEDDDWTDFISNPAPANHTRAKLKLPERTSTPDLQLSVFNLNQIQPPKQPIPVITPQGLVQTKLPTNTSIHPIKLDLSTQTLQSNRTNIVNDSYHSQPSIISNQFRAQFPQPIQQNTQAVNGWSNSILSTENKTVDDDDDDWSDFVSSPIPTSTSGDFQTKPTPSFIPNIITNPASFETFQKGFHKPKQTIALKHANVLKNNTIPSISAMPDLDFITPKSRSFVRK